MTNLYWEASGVSLHTEAWAIRTWGGGRQSSAPARGDDVLMPFGVGRRYTPKQRDSRTLPLPMWVTPLNPDGTRDSSKTLEQKRDENWQYLMSLFQFGRQFPLTKRLWIDETVVVVTAQGEVLDPPEPTVTGGYRLEFTVDVTLADPWFYGPATSVGVGTITVPGTEDTTHVTFQMTAGRITMPDGNWIQYNGTGTAVVDCHAGTAIMGGSYVNGLLDRNPRFPEWPRLRPGVNALTGAGTVTYEPAYA